MATPSKKRKVYTISEKLHLIERIKNGETKAKVSREISVPESTLRGWVKEEVRLREASNKSQAQAKKIHQDLNGMDETLEASNGWLSQHAIIIKSEQIHSKQCSEDETDTESCPSEQQLRIETTQFGNSKEKDSLKAEVHFTDSQWKKTKSEAWRKTKAWNEKFLNELTKNIVSFTPIPDLDISEARILLIGPVGAGKSSFYNTINSIFRGRITQRAGSGSAEQSITTSYTPYFVKAISGANLNFKLCDTRGLEESQDVLECNCLLEGNIPEYYQFNPSAPISPDKEGYISKPTLEDKVHCVAFVLDSTTLEVLPTKIVQKMKSFQTLMNQKGIPQVLLLTKIDRLCKSVKKDVTEVFKSKTVELSVEKASQLLGLPRSNVLPLKNYEDEILLEENISILALLSLRQILHFVEDYMENLADKMAANQRKMEKMNVKIFDQHVH